MNMLESIRTCYRKYATFSGRASRSEFWWYMLFNYIIVGIPLAMVSDPLDSAWSLANFIPALAVSARRLHDTDRSGWWQTLPFAALIFVIVGYAVGGFGLNWFDGAMFGSPVFWIGAVLGAGLYILLIVWFATPGTNGPNRFGDDPFGRIDAEVFS